MSIPAIKQPAIFLKRALRGNPINSYIENVNAYIFNSVIFVILYIMIN